MPRPDECAEVRMYRRWSCACRRRRRRRQRRSRRRVYDKARLVRYHCYFLFFIYCSKVCVRVPTYVRYTYKIYVRVLRWFAFFFPFRPRLPLNTGSRADGRVNYAISPAAAERTPPFARSSGAQWTTTTTRGVRRVRRFIFLFFHRHRAAAAAGFHGVKNKTTIKKI